MKQREHTEKELGERSKEKGKMRGERSTAVGILLVFMFAPLCGQERPKPEMATVDAVPARVTGTPTYTVLNINYLTSWMRYDGHSNHSPSGNDGMIFPWNTGSVVYQDGIVWGGKMFIDGTYQTPASTMAIRVGGGNYSVGTKAGRVNGLGASAVAEDPNGSNVRVYRIRRDYYTVWDGEFALEAGTLYEVDPNTTTSTQWAEVKAQYAKDWTEWPVAKGAPFIDRNGNGVYDAPPAFNLDGTAGPVFTADSLIAQGLDEPGVAGSDPQLPADQVIWTVYNDLDESTAGSLALSGSVGLEIQKTMWGYKRSDALGKMYFVRYRFINKGGIDTSAASGVQKGSFWIDSMYVGQWSDPDLGNFSDDLVGVDIARNTGYAYNGLNQDQEFWQFHLAPPAIGYHLLAGPTVQASGDSAFRNFRWVSGQRNLGVSSFVAWATGDLNPPVPLPNYQTLSGRWWKLLRGYAPLGDLNTPDIPFESGPFAPGPYRFSGDPVSGSGFIDGQGTAWSPAPGDRRMMATTGPFRIAPGDTQDVLWAVIGGLSADRLSAIEIMRYEQRVLRTLFDRGMRSPQAPAHPVVRVTELDREVVLSWGHDPVAVSKTEDPVIAGTYSFEGYVVYQLPEANSWKADWIPIATFDRSNGISVVAEDDVDDETQTLIRRILHEGTDAGVHRSIRITKDMLELYSNRPLVNGREYYFAVTAYNVSSRLADLPISLESAPVRLTVKPRIPFGTQLALASGDTIAVQRLSGSSEVRVTPVVIDPLAGTGDRFRVSLQTVDSSLTWVINNVTRSTVVRSGGTNFSGDEDYPIVDGVLVKISGPDSAGVADVFEFIIPAPIQGREVEMKGVDRIGVFPNPYYASAVSGASYYSIQRQFVTFNNLPQRTILRIYNLAGHLVRTLRKDSQTQFLEWNLQNEDGWLVASGLYLCHVELPDLQTSKVLKLAVISPMQGIR